MDPDERAELERRLGHRFRDPALLLQALTHPSWANEHPPAPDHERLAFLGDAVLGLVVSERLLGQDPAAPVGVLTPQRARLVSDEQLAGWATALALGPLLRLGRGAERDGGRTRPSILATTLEAVLGAVYVEDGLEAARRVVDRLAAW